MTTLPLPVLKTIQDSPAADAWEAILQYAWGVCSVPVQPEKASAEIARRERSIGAVDLFIATAAWDLWSEYEESVPHTAERLVEWWGEGSSGRAVLVLDGLSLREAPWLITEAENRGFVVQKAGPSGAELPADTNRFARALGFGQRSSLENDGAGGAHKLLGARTDSVNVPWQEAEKLIDSAPDWVLWHHWLDERIHELGAPGHGLSALTSEAVVQLTGDDFWSLVQRLTIGRRLIITSDHGYAASGHFPDTTDDKQAQHLKSRFKSGRCASAPVDQSQWVPPIDLVLDTPHGRFAFVLGRRKWKSQGGYPTLTHGGLSLLEVIVPYIEISRPTES